ncbi:MAG: hypothetical protein EPO13_11755 [Actinomycetota bacterium]|nr:MAG: hypothetical protein EPO13_11755 [Actinomycetota bacterium]
MTEHHDLASARAAVGELQRVVRALTAEHGDSIDVHRLAVDVSRLSDDLRLIVGDDALQRAAESREVILVPDGDYPPELFSDAHDEGIGRR